VGRTKMVIFYGVIRKFAFIGPTLQVQTWTIDGSKLDPPEASLRHATVDSGTLALGVHTMQGTWTCCLPACLPYRACCFLPNVCCGVQHSTISTPNRVG
jgi:hypothetical protein